MFWTRRGLCSHPKCHSCFPAGGAKGSYSNKISIVQQFFNREKYLSQSTVFVPKHSMDDSISDVIWLSHRRRLIRGDENIHIFSNDMFNSRYIQHSGEGRARCQRGGGRSGASSGSSEPNTLTPEVLRPSPSGWLSFSLFPCRTLLALISRIF